MVLVEAWRTMARRAATLGTTLALDTPAPVNRSVTDFVRSTVNAG
jgi:hypothetical protein